VRTSLLFLFSLLALSAVPRCAAAQCVLSGDAAIDAVTPRGTELTFGLDEEARVTLDGTRARVEGIRPIAFLGTAASRDVGLYVAADRDVRGVLSVAAGTEVRVTRVRGRRAASFIDAGAVRVALSLPCDQLALAPPTTEAELPAEEDDAAGRVLLPRGRSLQVFSGPRTFRGVRLALRVGMPSSEWPWLTPRGAAGTRVHVRATLVDGVVLDGWVERESVYSPGLLSATSWCGTGGAMCGHGYAGETYRGSARIAAGTGLRDEEGHVWGTLMEESEANVAISTTTMTVTSSAAGVVVHRTDTVWIEGIPGLIPDPCSALGVQVDRASVALPTDPH
jgi:hypothetical protein